MRGGPHGLSARISPDGMYYWDGQRWASTLSPDGRHRWNGSAWEPVVGPVYSGGYSQPRPQVREPTSWTRPLQYVVIAWFALRGIYQLSIPFWMSGLMSQYVQQSLQRQQQAYPPGEAPPPGLADMMNAVMTGSMWFGVILGVGLSVVAITGAVKRWTWAYYAVLVLLGFGLLGFVYNTVDLVAGGAITASSALQVPGWTRVVSIVTGTADAVLFVVMLIALVRRGPWGMRRIS